MRSIFDARCSSGSHTPGQSVTWTGVLDARRLASGVRVDWAYGPGDVKVLTSSDGSNFEETICWKKSTRSEVSFAETLMFETPVNVKAVMITMRSPQSWGYYGINSVSLVAEPSPFMLVRSSHTERARIYVLESLLISMCCSVALLRRAASSVLSVVPREYRWSLVWERSQLVMAARLCIWRRIARLVVYVFGKLERFFVCCRGRANQKFG